jgi:hydrogenase maturation protease
VSWEELQRPAPESVVVDGVELRRGSRVRLRPRAGADVFDIALAGRLAVVEAIEEDTDGAVHLVVTVDDDPGRDLGVAAQLAHRFFFAPAEVEPIVPRRILVAGVGNVFLGDDGFGVALADRLARRPLPAGVEVVDFGIRGMDLAYAMQSGLEAVILLDAAPRGLVPGTLSVVEPDAADEPMAVDAHGMDPLAVLALARELAPPGATLPRILIVCCEPETRMTGEEDEIVVALSAPVLAALDPAAVLVEELLADLTTHEEEGSTS